jgi:hypothetical protein
VLRFFRLLVCVCLSITLIACDANQDGKKQDSKNLQSEETSTASAVIVENGLVNISAVDVSQLDLLRELAKQAGFNLQLYHQDWDTVSLTMTKASFEDVIKTILGPVPHEIHFRPDASGVIEYVSVGDESDEEQADVSENEEDAEAEVISKDQVTAMSDEEKLDFLPFVEPSAENFPVLVDFMKNDTNAEVRIAAMAAVENAETPEAVKAIVDLLADADSRIVLAAIDSLEFAGSEADIKSLEPLLKHPDPEVQSAVRDAIDFLRE